MFQARLSRQALISWFALFAFVAVNFLVFPVLAAEKARLRVENYDIDAELSPRAHKLTAKAKVRFTALDDLSAATFELHNALRPTKVTDEAGKTLQVERISQDNAIRVGLPDGLAKGRTATLNFEYEGTLDSADDSPVPGVKLASVGEDTSYLLYAGRWFPVSNYGINRFTATIRVTLPAHMTVIGSGTPTVTNFGESKPISPPVDKPLPSKDIPVLSRKKTTAVSKKKVATNATKKTTKTTPPPAPEAAKSQAGKVEPGKSGLPTSEPASTEPGTTESTQPVAGSALPRRTWTFTWDKPSFPGTIIAGIFTETKPVGTGANVHVFFKPSKQIYASAYGETAGKEFVYFAGLYTPALTPNLKLVELPDDSVPSAWAPEIAAISSRAIQQKTNYRLLANTIARQWWGGIVIFIGNNTRGTASTLLAPGAVAAALLLVLAPSAWRLAREREAERAARIRTEERADFAARVHDSVLQTLTLIQKDPADARRLARRQERELRAWFYSDREATAEGTLADAVSQGYLSFSGDATSTTLSVDADGAAGPGAAVTMCTFTDIGFVDSTTSQTDFADNIFVV